MCNEGAQCVGAGRGWWQDLCDRWLGYTGSSSNSVEAYDPQLARRLGSGGEHECEAPVPCLGGVVLEGKIYAVGGYDDGAAMLDTVEVYGRGPSGRQLAAGGEHAAKAVWTRRSSDGWQQDLCDWWEIQQGLVNSAYVYDPQADAWTHLASMNGPRRFHASAAVGGQALPLWRDWRRGAS